MQVEITWQTIITVASVLAAVIAISKYVKGAVRWMDNQSRQDEEIKLLKEENKIHTIGILACLKGLAEQGCDGPVHEAIEMIEKHLNEGAHK